MIIRWSERARAQIREIVRYIARDRPSASERFLEGLLERMDLLTEFPEQGPLWEPSRRSDIRNLLEGLTRR